MSSSGSGAGGCLGALLGLLFIDLLMKMALFPLFGINTKTNWQLYSTILVTIIIVAVVAAVVVEIVFSVKDKDSTKDSKPNEKLEKNDCDSANGEKTGERA